MITSPSSSPSTTASSNQPKKLSKSDRTSILDAARELFAEHGYDGASIRDIAGRASIDPAMVCQ
ncbi:helix-turn-helix domain-containing protein [Mesorhizobium sp. WSM4887]|uniref:TetR family transcriptional regulator n=1 Tax=Mesorhizobium sp. WSM4887 TaxID=3038543 RepID=UPI0024179063|nr:helix-turn-helix domain-containing protein [Mesorhizobium sp. WSM4887]